MRNSSESPPWVLFPYSNRIQLTSISQENRKKRWPMGSKLTISVLAYDCHDRNLSSFLLGKMATERKQQQRQEKSERMEIAVSQGSDREMSDCSKTGCHTPALSVHMHAHIPGWPFCSNMVQFSHNKEKNTQSNYFPFIVDCRKVRIYQQQVLTELAADRCLLVCQSL